MIAVLIAIITSACVAPVWTHTWRLPRSVLALFPAAAFFYCLQWWPEVSGGNVVLQSWSWMPSIGLSLSFFIDGLSLLFLLLITGIGSFIVLYASSYMKGHKDEGRFFFWLLMFMAAMLGLVASDNLVALFVFWELTSFTSYMLIGFNHESEKARKMALQGLFVTVGGGLALMTGFIMLGSLTGSYQLSEIVQQPLSASTETSAFVNTMLVLILWSTLQQWAGATTMLLGALLAYLSTDLKKVLAYSTLMALGTLTLLLGVGGEYALVAFVSYLLAHALYKASLFMLAGGIDHSTGTKNLLDLQGLRNVMPLTFVLMRQLHWWQAYPS